MQVSCRGTSKAAIGARQQSQQHRRSGACPRRHVCYAGPRVWEGELFAKKEHKYGVVVARFNDLVTKLLLEGALDKFKKHGVEGENIDVAWVPGSFELGVVAQQMAKSSQYAAILCIGAVVRGDTGHYDAVVSGVTSGVASASSSTGVPVIFGVLTTDTMEQALDRAGGKAGNKGGETALTAIEMANLMQQLREKDVPDS